MLSLEQGPVPCHVGFFHPFLGTCHHVDMGKIPKRTGNLLLGFQQLAFQLPILLKTFPLGVYKKEDVLPCKEYVKTFKVSQA